jgi:hypothetical protein
MHVQAYSSAQIKRLIKKTRISVVFIRHCFNIFTLLRKIIGLKTDQQATPNKIHLSQYILRTVDEIKITRLSTYMYKQQV